MAHPIDMEAIAEIESSNNPNAISKDGCVGLFQISEIALAHFNSEQKKTLNSEIMERASFDTTMAVVWKTDFHKTHTFARKDLFDPSVNRIVADWYFQWLYDRIGNEYETLIAYNWGFGNWRYWVNEGSNFKKLPEETQAYIKKYDQLTWRGDL